MRKASKAEYENFLRTYPRCLTVGVGGIIEPASINHYDFTLPKGQQDVAHTFAYSDDPENRYYVPEDERVYWIREQEGDE